MKRMASFVAVLVLVICLFGTCCADYSSKVGSISVSVFTGSEWEQVHKEMGHAHLSDTFFGDGILAFTSLESCISMGMGDYLQEYVLDENFTFKAVVEEPFDENTSLRFNVYTWDDGKLNRCDFSLSVETPENGVWLIKDWTSLENGRYLIEAAYSVTEDTYYYSGSAVFWLMVREASESGPQAG